MNELELRRIRKSDKRISAICVEAKQSGKSYGQLQAERYEKQQRFGELVSDINRQTTPTLYKKYSGNKPKAKPDGWKEIAMMVVNKQLTKSAAAECLKISLPTLKKWIAELVSNSENC